MEPWVSYSCYIVMIGFWANKYSCHELLLGLVPPGKLMARFSCCPGPTRRFREAISFTDNEGTLNGGGFASLNEGSVTFAQPDLVTASGNNVR